MMRRLLLLSILLAPLTAGAAGGGPAPFEFEPNLGNAASLQRGAKLYMNYCSGCHTLKYMRYSRMAEDLNMPEDLVEKNLLFTRGRIHDQIDGTMPDKAAEWFGQAPPDLSLVTRSRGDDWVYSFLLSFYLDDETASGVNNLVLSNTAMPHALWPLQGYQKLLHSGKTYDASAHAEPEFEIAQAGSMSQAEYRDAVGDITNFLVYVGEPAKMVRYSLGVKVITFLLIFTLLAWLLKREYWKDVH